MVKGLEKSTMVWKKTMSKLKQRVLLLAVAVAVDIVVLVRETISLSLRLSLFPFPSPFPSLTTLSLRIFENVTNLSISVAGVI